MSKLSVYYRQFQAFTKASFLSQIRNPGALFFGFLFPIAFLFVFGLLGNTSNSKISIGFISNNLPQAALVRQALQNSQLYTLNDGDKNNLIERIQAPIGDPNYDLSGLVEVQTEQIIVYKNRGKPRDSAILGLSIESYLNQQALSKAGVKESLRIQNTNIDSSQTRYLDFALPGLLGFTLLTAGINGTAFSFQTLRKTKALKRLFATPASKPIFLIGQAAGRMIVTLFQDIVIITLAVLVFNYSPINGIWSILQMLILVILGIFMFLGIGYIIAGLAQSEDTVAPASQLVVLPQLLLGGVFFSITTFPFWVQSISKLLPVYALNEALRGVSISGYYLWSQSTVAHILVMIFWTIFAYFIASKVFRIT